MQNQTDNKKITPTLFSAAAVIFLSYKTATGGKFIFCKTLYIPGFFPGWLIKCVRNVCM